MFQPFRNAAANLQASTDLLRALVEASANEQKLLNDGFSAISKGSASVQERVNAALPALVQGSAKLQASINAMLPALVAGSANTQHLIQQLMVRLDAQAAQVAAATGVPAPELSPVPELAPVPEPAPVPELAAMPEFVHVSGPAHEGPARGRTMFAERLDTKGVAIIREFFDTKEAAGLSELVNAVYGVMDKAPSAEFAALHPDFEKNFSSWHGVWLEPLPAFLENYPQLAVRYQAFIERIRTCTRGVFGGEWDYYPARSFFRRHQGMSKKVPWHIDADAAHIGREDCFNVWMPLDSVGVDLPSLEVVPGSNITMRAVPLQTDADRWRDDAFVEKIGTYFAPPMEPGDAMAFDQYTLHRTQLVESQGVVRTACEFRFARV
jgi:ectoine hydroxylase-related dioxygenase (phytanoyl-CoA dioxygenase family)